MTKAEKIFWWSIGVLLSIFIIVNIIAIDNHPVDKDTQKPVLHKFVEKIVKSDIVLRNLSQNQQNIINSLGRELNSTYDSVDMEIDRLFVPVYANIDKFLDYHYSIIGEYSQLGAMAFGDIDEMITQKLLGDDFDFRGNEAYLSIDKEYKANLQNHLSTIDEYATEGVDLSINSEALATLKSDIDSHLLQQKIKIGIFGGVIVAKIMAIVSAKIAIKSSAKLVAKSTALTTGALAGLSCGPLAWLCSPIGAGALWIATDGIVVSGDEYLSRDGFRLEIVEAIDSYRQNLKNSYKESYHKSFQDLSASSIQKYQKAEIKEKKMIRESINL